MHLNLIQLWKHPWNFSTNHQSSFQFKILKRLNIFLETYYCGEGNQTCYIIQNCKKNYLTFLKGLLPSAFSFPTVLLCEFLKASCWLSSAKASDIQLKPSTYVTWPLSQILLRFVPWIMKFKKTIIICWELLIQMFKAFNSLKWLTCNFSL